MLVRCLSAHKPARALTFCLPLLLPCSSLYAATVTLNNGDQLSGELKQLTNGTLILQSSMIGEVKIPWNKVRALISYDKVRVQMADGALVEGKLAVNPDGQAAVEQSATQTVNVPRQAINAVNPPPVDNGFKFSGKIDLGGSFTNGNSEDDQLHSNGEVVARSPDDRYTLRWEINEARSAGIKTTANRRLLTQYDHFLDPKNYLFLNAKAERDEFADLNLRTSAGGGYGRQFIDTDTTKLSAEIGLSYVNEDYSNSPDRSFPSLGLGLKYEHKFFNQKLVFFNNFDADQSLEDSSDLLLHNRMGVRIPIANGLNLSTQFNVDYDGEPAAGKKSTDSAVIFSVGYAF
jgi:putative salt-induced outer membrane protein YdiY